jgi:hypothetical protein
VAEASEHVLRFDWDDIALRTRGIYDGLARRAPRTPRATRTPTAPRAPREQVRRG